ncbi:sigma-70 family RNA polymerase sigma factor [Ruminococcus sp.]|uniref:RNA polymerase sigma factor n=1 Tax=Ruminococcus sp. TaxID=41978 RepID=UPI0025F6805C|nr:sigma-70 family RNA polymerase sigma factor [Ruminococcus sp.]MCR4638288.1 sigma-70 family RNA polymerase sigma factor [Ruminococcus sp.]
MTNEEIQNAAEKSKENAQRAIFDRYFSYVYTIIFSKLRSCASREDIEECVGDVFSDIYIYYEESKAVNGDISGFVGTVARRKAINVFNRITRRTVPAVSVDSEEAAAIEAPDNTVETVERRELRSTLLRCIEELGEPDSTIIMQKYFFDRSSKEIGELVSMTPENVRVRSGRALDRLRKQLENLGIKECNI